MLEDFPSCLPTQDVGLFLSALMFVLASFVLLMSRRVNGTAPPTVKLALIVLWLYSALRLYSASSYLWGSTIAEAGLVAWSRMIVFAVVTIMAIGMVALAAFYWRRMRG